MSARLTATDAVLACAAATTRAELHAARMALVTSGASTLTVDLDTSGMVAGDGTAGRVLLGGTGWTRNDSTAARSSRIQTRLFADLAVTPEPGGAR